MLEKPGQMNSGHAERARESPGSLLECHSRVGRQMEAARAPGIIFVVPTDIHSSLCPSGGTQQKAEGSTHWEGPGVRRKTVSSTQTSWQQPMAWSLDSSQYGKHAVGMKAHSPRVRTRELSWGPRGQPLDYSLALQPRCCCACSPLHSGSILETKGGGRTPKKGDQPWKGISTLN